MKKEDKNKRHILSTIVIYTVLTIVIIMLIGAFITLISYLF